MLRRSSGFRCCSNAPRSNRFSIKALLWCAVVTAFLTFSANVVVVQALSREDSRMIAYLGNWHACPTDSQVAQYTHIAVGFAITYTYAEPKNSCSSTCEISEPTLCSNTMNTDLIKQWQSQGKKVILSFGGAGMGGSWEGDANDCWLYCFGRETQVVDKLVEFVNRYNFDGIDIDYEYFYEDGQMGKSFPQGEQAIKFLTDVTLGLRQKLPAGAELTHAPMDLDLVPGTAYFKMLKDIAYTLDFLMPQMYNGVTRPAVDGFNSAGAGKMASSVHYKDLVEQVFGSDPTRVVFGFCIADCATSGSNADATQAAAVMQDLGKQYPCNGGAFFWVVKDDINGAWSQEVNQVMDFNRGCSAPLDGGSGSSSSGGGSISGDGRSSGSSSSGGDVSSGGDGSSNSGGSSSSGSSSSGSSSSSSNGSSTASSGGGAAPPPSPDASSYLSQPTIRPLPERLYDPREDQQNASEAFNRGRPWICALSISVLLAVSLAWI